MGCCQEWVAPLTINLTIVLRVSWIEHLLMYIYALIHPCSFYTKLVKFPCVLTSVLNHCKIVKKGCHYALSGSIWVTKRHKELLSSSFSSCWCWPIKNLEAILPHEGPWYYLHASLRRLLRQHLKAFLKWLLLYYIHQTPHTSWSHHQSQTIGVGGVGATISLFVIG